MVTKKEIQRLEDVNKNLHLYLGKLEAYALALKQAIQKHKRWWNVQIKSGSSTHTPSSAEYELWKALKEANKI